MVMFRGGSALPSVIRTGPPVLGPPKAALERVRQSINCALFRNSVETGPDLKEWLVQRRLADLQREIDQKDEQLRTLRHQLTALLAQGRTERELPASVVDVVGRIVAMTEGEFCGRVSIEHMFDPEDPQHSWLVFTCAATGAAEEMRERKFRWYDEVVKLVPGTLDEFRLCLVPQS